ncbi:n-6 adenine-specific dna methylases signature [Lucifera butyrica]|uniref:N-6 adenine-specific dna methylases signature n=1 Tax=Lucifera butyrica TaxID=1351585 RepID=A0A498R6A5_9FIRM|nr:tRNA1(Val) (adenine(37)-N6)-methyltransferase [Lucifera butyrica]VBB06585.1 n-6 adenine-specific dna methylases signature [Lucifera butyrica]
MGEADLLLPGERLDDLLIQGLKIIQHPREFCFSLDAVLLAHFAFFRPGWRVADLGSGTGVIGFLLAARGAGYVTGLEISPYMADMAKRSILLNKLAAKMQVIQGDFRKVNQLLPAGEWDLVVSNPPYRPLGKGAVSPNDRVALARHEVAANLDDVIQAARYLVKYRGRFAMVHLPERMAEILQKMSAAGLEPKRVRLIHPVLHKKPAMLLVEGIRGARPGVDVMPPLAVYTAAGDYSKEIKSYYA